LSEDEIARKPQKGTDAGCERQTRRVKVMNADWIGGGEGEDGRFELMIA